MTTTAPPTPSAPQAPYHRWRANEDPDVTPLGLHDRCLDCGTARYDPLDRPSVGAPRRALAVQRNKRAIAACPGPRQ